LEVTKYVTASSRMPAFAGFTSEQIWTSIQEHKHTKSQSEANDVDLKIAEWDTLTQYPVPPPTKDFRVSRIKPPVGFEHLFEETILLELLREVRALLAFNRIESKGDFADAAFTDDDRQTRLSRQSPTWLPASEVRGEGIFLRLKEEAIQKWEHLPEVLKLEREFFQAHVSWRRLRNLNPVDAGFPGIRFCSSSFIVSCTHASDCVGVWLYRSEYPRTSVL